MIYYRRVIYLEKLFGFTDVLSYIQIFKNVPFHIKEVSKKALRLVRAKNPRPQVAVKVSTSGVQGKTITKGDSLRKNASPVSSSQLSRPGRQFDLDSNPLEGTSKSFLQQVSSKLSDKD